MLYLARVGGSILSIKSLTLVGGGTLFSIVVISPIVEELIFRGVFLNKLQLVVPTLFAVSISSLLFASLHAFGSIFSAFIFGVCISILYLKTENILVAIFTHFLNNLIGESIFYADSQKILFSNDLVMAIMSVLAVISFILIVKYIISSWNNLNNSKIN
ncbi:CPBP family intramembrane glutamic endopeptidase [uncultured Methanobrevibacter sp.]|uniref:CPBP family intramembrane glutamic endopeptidase n=1 Tax=uncultured Methanobrevibacter sp. TaxID=253161 RepID=UPI00260B5B23|nr:CPBP family intramembrane glutamic endopeptidase [uncultured Methanobrevibacter sp.]